MYSIFVNLSTVIGQKSDNLSIFLCQRKKKQSATFISLYILTVGVNYLMKFAMISDPTFIATWIANWPATIATFPTTPLFGLVLDSTFSKATSP